MLAWLEPASVVTFRAYSLPARSPSKRKVVAAGRRDTFLSRVWEWLCHRARL